LPLKIYTLMLLALSFDEPILQRTLLFPHLDKGKACRASSDFPALHHPE